MSINSIAASNMCHISFAPACGRPVAMIAGTSGDHGRRSYRDGVAYCVNSLRMIRPPFITNLTR